MPTDTFVHLDLHSEYSLVDGIVRISELVPRVQELGMPAVAITDVANVYGLVKFFRKCLSSGIKPILGVQVATSLDEHDTTNQKFIVLCRDNLGYKALSELLTQAYLQPRRHGEVCVNYAGLSAAAEHLLLLTDIACGVSNIGSLHEVDTNNQLRLERLQRDFDQGVYLTLARVGAIDESDINSYTLDVAHRLGLPLVATNQVRFLHPQNYEAHEIRVCINEGRVLEDTRRTRHFTEQQFLRSSEEMQTLFSDLPEAFANSVEIARRCNVFLDFEQTLLPAYPLPANTTADEALERETRKQLDTLSQNLDFDEERKSQYVNRLERELGVIQEMGFAGYFLIVADFIRWAKEQRIPVGPGRGSGAGSLVAFSLGITELDPIEHGLLFERFLNPERVSLPDFDIDFCMEGRDRVIEYVANRYGQDHVAQIITYGSMAARAVVRDVGRVMGLPYGFVDSIAKLIPFEVGMTLEKALQQEEMLRQRCEQESEVGELIEQARLLEGLPRNVGKHAGGVVIAPSALTDYMPLYHEAGMSQPVSQLDKDDLEAIGLVKFDFLGLRTLTIIDKALKLIDQHRATAGEAKLNFTALNMDDAKTYKLIQTGKTTGLFQLESRGMKDLITRLQPDKFDDLVALVALFRPGPLQSGMVDDFVNRKHGRERNKYPHPTLEPILKPTYGVILYQEQVMEIAQELAGYTLGAADLLRRAMGKKKPEEMAKQRSIFLQGAAENKIDSKTAAYIFDLMEKFAGYGFNKSHSAAYALITYQTAWLKTHYPASFMAASLSSDMEHTDRVVTLIAECRDMRIKIHSPNINRCQLGFTPINEEEVLYGLGAIKGVGQGAIEAIVEQREIAGPYKSLFDFCHRIDNRKVNKRTMESLIRSGAMDGLGEHRAQLLADLPVTIGGADQHAQNRSAGQEDLFGAAAIEQAPPTQRQVSEWNDEQRLTAEKETLGLYLSGHPIDPYQEELRQIIDFSLADLNPSESRVATVSGLIVGLRIMNTRRGDKMAFITLDDNTGRLDVSVFSELFRERRDLLCKDALIVLRGQVDVDEYTNGFQMRAEEIFALEGLREQYVSRLIIDMREQQLANGTLNRLQEAFAANRGGKGQIWLRYQRQDGEIAGLELGPEWSVRPSPQLIDSLNQIVGNGSIRLQYDTSALRH